MLELGRGREDKDEGTFLEADFSRGITKTCYTQVEYNTEITAHKSIEKKYIQQ